MGHSALRCWPLALVALAAGPKAPVQSQASFEAAIKNHSTAPPYVLVTVVDDRTKTERSVCTTSNLLLGAIYFEHGLGTGAQAWAEAERIALSNRDHVFHFSKPKALENVAPTYTEKDLETIRAKLAPLSVEQLRQGFSGSGDLHAIYRVQPRERHTAYRDATACVLIERGLSPGMGDVSDQLWLAH